MLTKKPPQMIQSGGKVAFMMRLRQDKRGCVNGCNRLRPTSLMFPVRVDACFAPTKSGKSNPLFGVSIHQIVFPFAYRNDCNQHKIVANLVDQTIPCVAKFYFVAIG